MGFIKTAKANAISSDAQKAWDNDRTVFTPILNMPGSKFGFSGAIDDWALMLDAIADVGWKLHTWAVGTDKDGRPQAMPLFTR